MVAVDVTEFLVSLLDVHKMQLQALTKQGEIQAKVLKELLKDGLSRTLDIPLSQDKDKQRTPSMTVENRESAEWCTRLTELFQAEVQMNNNLTRPQRSLDTESWTVEDQSRQDFLSLKYDPHKGVRELGKKLDSAAKRWLRPDLRTAAQVEQCVAMEKFLSLLPSEAAVCVQKQHPRDMEEAISLAERWIGCGDSLHAASADTHTDSEQGSTDAPEHGGDEIRQGASNQPDALSESFLDQTEPVKLESILTLEVPDLGTPSLEKEQRPSTPQEVSLVLKQEVVEPDFSEGSEWAEDRAQAEPFHMPVSSRGQGSMSVSGGVPLPQRCSLTSTIPTTSSQAFQQSPPAPDSYHLFVQDSPVTARLRGINSAMIDAETGLSAGYTGLFSQDGQQTWRTPPRLPSPLHSQLSSPSHQCPDCGCCFTQQRSLREHRNIHTGERPFVCGLCGKAFCHRRTLNKHTRIHSRERPFHCDFCGQTFKLKDTMKRHQMAHCRHTP